MVGELGLGGLQGAGGRRARTELCRLTSYQGQGRPAGEEKGGYSQTTFVGWGNAAGCGAGRVHWGAAQTTGKGTPPREWVTENPCPCGCQVPAPGQPGAQSAPDEQAAGGRLGTRVRFPPPERRALLLAPGHHPGSLPAYLPEGGGPRSAHPHLPLFIFGCATWLVGSSFPVRI